MSELSLRETAKMIGVHYTTLQRLEMGKPPDAENLRRILNWLLSESRDL